MNTIPINQIKPNPQQPRTEFDQAELQDLAQSIKEDGLIQAITVTPNGNGYFLEDGERRWRAAQLAGLTEIPAVVTWEDGDLPDDKRLVRALVANLQRADLNIIEEGRAYQALRDQYGWTIMRIANHTGKARATIKNALSWLELEEPIQQAAAKGHFPRSERVVKALASIEDSEARLKIAGRLNYKGVSISLIETACREFTKASKRQTAKTVTGIPAVQFGEERARTGPTPIYDQLHKQKRLPSWDLFLEAAESTCKACALYDVADEKTCAECGAVQLVANVVTLKMEDPK